MELRVSESKLMSKPLTMKCSSPEPEPAQKIL